MMLAKIYIFSDYEYIFYSFVFRRTLIDEPLENLWITQQSWQPIHQILQPPIQQTITQPHLQFHHHVFLHHPCVIAEHSNI